MIHSTKVAALIGAACIVTSFPGLAASVYPSEPVRLIVPYAPGGTTDLLARILGQKLSEKYGQQFIIENKTGAGGNIAASALARARPDGYTLMMASIGQFAINPLIFAKPGYDVRTDFKPVVAVAEVPNVLVTSAQSDIESIQDLLKKAKDHPGDIAFASSGNGSSNHLAGVLLSKMADVQLMHVPYKGSAPGLQAIYSGDVQVMFDNLSSALPHIESGRLRALGSTSLTRPQQLSRVPTIEESGLSGYEASAWFGIVAPGLAPQAIAEKLNADINAILQDKEVAAQLVKMGMTPLGGSTEQFEERISGDMKKWETVVRDAKLTVN